MPLLMDPRRPDVSSAKWLVPYGPRFNTERYGSAAAENVAQEEPTDDELASVTDAPIQWDSIRWEVATVDEAAYVFVPSYTGVLVQPVLAIDGHVALVRRPFTRDDKAVSIWSTTLSRPPE